MELLVRSRQTKSEYVRDKLLSFFSQPKNNFLHLTAVNLWLAFRPSESQGGNQPAQTTVFHHSFNFQASCLLTEGVMTPTLALFSLLYSLSVFNQELTEMNAFSSLHAKLNLAEKHTLVFQSHREAMPASFIYRVVM